jgi:hypothetical protein
MNFTLTYYEHSEESAGLVGGLFGGSSKKKSVVIEEHYQSRHLAEILHGYTQIIEAIEREEKELGGVGDFFSSDSNSSPLDNRPTNLATPDLGR